MAAKEKGRIDLSVAQFVTLYSKREEIMKAIVDREGHELPPRPETDKNKGATAADKEKEQRQRTGAQYVVTSAVLGILEDGNKDLLKSRDLTNAIKEGLKRVNNGDLMKKIYSHYSSSMRQHSPNYANLCTMIQNCHTVAGQKRILALAKQRISDMPNLANEEEQIKKGKKRTQRSASASGNRFYFKILCIYFDFHLKFRGKSG